MALHMDIYSKDLDLTDRIKDYATKKSVNWINSSVRSANVGLI